EDTGQITGALGGDGTARIADAVARWRQRARGCAEVWAPARRPGRRARRANPARRRHCGGALQAVLCRVTWDEHKRVLIVAFRLEQKEIYQQMLSCELDGLAALGWQRYESVGLRTYPVMMSSSASARR